MRPVRPVRATLPPFKRSAPASRRANVVDNERARERVSVIEEIQDLLLTTDNIDQFLSDVHGWPRVNSLSTPSAGSRCRESMARPRSPAATTAPRGVDELQYTAGDGPCLHAMREGVQVVIDDFADETRWPEYCIQATANGIRSSFSLPLPAAVLRPAATTHVTTRIRSLWQNTSV
jgi:hypothetical protein